MARTRLLQVALQCDVALTKCSNMLHSKLGVLLRPRSFRRFVPLLACVLCFSLPGLGRPVARYCFVCLTESVLYCRYFVNVQLQMVPRAARVIGWLSWQGLSFQVPLSVGRCALSTTQSKGGKEVTAASGTLLPCAIIRTSQCAVVHRAQLQLNGKLEYLLSICSRLCLLRCCTQFVDWDAAEHISMRDAERQT